jgi:hypothetical protein
MESTFKYTFTDSQLTVPVIENVEDFGPGAIITIFNVSGTDEWNNTISLISNGGNNRNYTINVIPLRSPLLSSMLFLL